MSADAHGDHGHGDGNTTKNSSFYSTIAAVIVIVFLLIAAWSIFGSSNEKKVIMKTVIGKGTLVSQDAEVDLQNEMAIGQYHYYTLMPGVSFKANDNPSEYYPYDFPNGSDGLTAVDDQGNENLRAGTLYVTFTNNSDKPITIGFGRCRVYDGCNIDFTNLALEAGTSGFVTEDTLNEDNPTQTILRWVTFVVLVVMGFLVMVALIVKFSPKTLVKARWGVKDGHDEHDAHHHGHGHRTGHDHDHAVDNNGFNAGFFIVLGLSLIMGVVTLYTLHVNDGVDAWYALIPFVGFAFFTYLIHMGGVSVDPHVIKLVLSRFNQAQATQFHQGEGWVMPWFYTLGIPDSQGGAPDVNLDKRKEKLNPTNDPKKVTYMFNDKKFVELREFEFMVWAMDANVDWIMRFPGATTESFNEIIRNEYYKAIAIVARRNKLDQALAIVKRRLPDADPSDPEGESFDLCRDVDTIVRHSLSTMGIKLHVFSSMGQPAFVGKLRDAMALASEIEQAKAVIKTNFPSLSETEIERRMRILLNISTENFDIKGLDTNTLAAITQIATAILAKKK